jgi:hypothetical protein
MTGIPSWLSPFSRGELKATVAVGHKDFATVLEDTAGTRDLGAMTTTGQRRRGRNTPFGRSALSDATTAGCRADDVDTTRSDCEHHNQRRVRLRARIQWSTSVNCRDRAWSVAS